MDQYAQIVQQDNLVAVELRLHVHLVQLEHLVELALVHVYLVQLEHLVELVLVHVRLVQLVHIVGLVHHHALLVGQVQRVQLDQLRQRLALVQQILI